MICNTDVATASGPGELLAWVAATFTWLAFMGTRMGWVRSLALSANLAFIAYGWNAGLWPVLVLHLALAPVNLWRLVQLWRQPTAWVRAP
jgi:CRP/FNR family transcriptional regulator, cyclic AMP receptor protein